MMDKKIVTYMNVNGAYQPKVIPKSSTFTFLSKRSGMPQVWTLDDDQKPVQYVEFDDTVTNISHAPNGKMSVVEKDHNGNEKKQFYLLVHDDEPTIEELAVSPVHFHEFGGWSPDSKQIVYSSNRRHPGYFDVFVLDVETKTTKVIYERDGNCTPMTWLPDGKHILVNIPETSLDQNIYKLSIETGEMQRIGNENHAARYHSFIFPKNEERAYVITDIYEETKYISRFSFDNPGEFEKVMHDEKWDIEEVKISSDEQTLVYTINEGGIYKLYVYDVAAGTHKEIVKIPKGVIESISWLDENTFVFGVNTPMCPGDIWQYTMSTDQVERLTYISDSKEIGHLLREPKMCTFTSFDGLEVPYFYYEKNDNKHKPTVLYVHGGPSVQTRAEFNYYIQYLVEQGFAVAAPNVRGSSGYGRTYLGLDDVRKRMDSVKDLVWLVEDLIETHNVDPEKVGIMGRSYGGFMVLAAISHYPDVWAAAVDIVGISSFETFLESTGDWRRKLRESEYGSLEKDREFFNDIDPIHHSHKIKTPLLVYHGLNDSRVPVTEAIQIVKAMKERKQDVELTIFDDEGHFTEKNHNHVDMDGNIVRFMEEKLRK